MPLVGLEVSRNENARHVTGLTHRQTRALIAVVVHAVFFDGPVSGASVTAIVSKIDGIDDAGRELPKLWKLGWLDLVSKEGMTRYFRPRVRALTTVFGWAGDVQRGPVQEFGPGVVRAVRGERQELAEVG